MVVPGARQTSLLDEELLAGVPVLVFANKQDLLNAMTAADVRTALVPASHSLLHPSMQSPASTQRAQDDTRG